MHPLALIGVWSGNANLGNFTFMVALEFLRVTMNNNEEVRAFIDVPDFYVDRYFISDMSFDGDEIRFHLPSLEGSYKGKFDENKISGFWSDDDGSMSFPIEFRKTRGKTLYNEPKPQTPKAPFPYTEEEVSFKVPNAEIYGTLTYPNDKTISFGVVLCHGPDGDDRDATYFEHKQFAVLADYLTRHGIAVLRYDERGVGKSTGKKGMGWIPYRENVVAAAQYLGDRDDLDIEYVGVLGHGLGGISALLAANYSDDVDFLVVLATPGLPFEKVLSLQGKAITKVLKRPPMYEEAMEKFFSYLYKEGGEEKDSKKLEEKVIKDLDEYIEKKLSENDEAGAVILSTLKREFIQYGYGKLFTNENYWFRVAWDYDPAEIMKEVDIPVLGLWASNDVEIVPKENLEAFKNGLVNADPDNELRILDGLNHFFQTSETGNPFETPILSETISPKALNAISNWILEEVDDEEDDDDDNKKLSLKTLIKAF